MVFVERVDPARVAVAAFARDRIDEPDRIGAEIAVLPKRADTVP